MFTRRHVLKTSAATAVTLAAPSVWTSARASQIIYVADAGGRNTEVNREFLYLPFEKETGIKVEPVTRRGTPTAEIKAQAETKNYIWDCVANIGIDEVMVWGEAGLLEPLDMTGANVKDLPASMKPKPYYIPLSLSAFTLVYRPSATKKEMTSYADMWDASIPGVRSLRQAGRDNIEVALVADGVPGPDVATVLATEEGWKRAFAKLDVIRPIISTWWKAAPQSSQLLSTGEIDVTPTFSNRAFELIAQGEKLEICWNQARYNHYGWCVPKGNPKIEIVNKLIDFGSRPEVQAKCTTTLGSGPTNPNSLSFVDQKLQALMPTHPDNLKVMYPLDIDFWSKNFAQAEERFNAWFVQ